MAKREDEAIAWFIRVREPSFSDWEAFTAWLERDPANSDAFDAVALTDDGLDDLNAAASARAPLEAWRPAATSSRPSRRGLLGWAVAASVLFAGGLAYQVVGGSTQLIETRPGETRSVTLADGSRIQINGGSTLVLDTSEPRFAELRRGEALFTIVHDERRPFTVEAGPARIVDLGTVFNVVRSEATTDVAVAEGAVLFDPDGKAVRLAPGERLRADDEGAEATVANVDRAAVGAWTGGTLVYEEATIAEIAADLSRNLGVSVRPDPAVAPRAFSGVLQIGRGEPDALQKVAPVLGVGLRRVDDGWVLTSDTGSRD